MPVHAPAPPARPDADAAPRNRILAALPPDEWARLRERMEWVPMPLRKVVFQPNQPIPHVYFMEEGMVSILGLVEDGSAVETATVGNEGMVGVPVFLGAMQMAAQAFVQVAGSAWRLPSAALRDEVRRATAVADALGRYTQALFTLVAQSSACNRKHAVEQRCARWLLMTHDRVSHDTFGLTQLFLSQMLGVRRATVSEAAGALQQARLIEYSRGRITVLDRAGLEAAACVCYGVIRAEFARMVDGAPITSPLDALHISANDKSIAGDGTPSPGANRLG
jgi:CRP-like cAMP-binding protein